MTNSEIEARARRAYETEKRAYCERTRQDFTPWDSISIAIRSEWARIARAVLEDSPVDPFEEWWENYPQRGVGVKAICRAAWDAATAARKHGEKQ